MSSHAPETADMSRPLQRLIGITYTLGFVALALFFTGAPDGAVHWTAALAAVFAVAAAFRLEREEGRR